jgi:hypothetical protein
MMKILYYDCFAGISGDMNLGAMIDLGVEPKDLICGLKKLHLNGYEIKIFKDERKGIVGTKVDVVLQQRDETYASHAIHDRTYADIVELIHESHLLENVKLLSLNIFMKIAQAEAKVHGCDIDHVHFHEIGAIDSIVDIVGAAICLDFLKADRIYSSPVELGGGFVKCAHGLWPVPAPATAEILKGIPVKSGIVPFETTTPTGAAILAAIVDRFTERLDFTPEKIGYGIGKRDMEIPNALRVFIGEAENSIADAEAETHDAFLVECNIDDMNPEMYNSAMDALFQKGAYDVCLTPVIMKKSRPAVQISILCGAEMLQDIEEVLWLQTTTFGLRISKVVKKMLTRDFSEKATKYGKVSMKNAYFRGKKIKSKPEYEDCKRLAQEKGVSVKEVYDSLNKE